LETKAFIKELKSILIRTIFLNIAVYLISVIFIDFTLTVAIGLLIGTFGMSLNLFLLNKSLYSVIKFGGNKSSTKMIAGYLIRMSIVSALTVITMLYDATCMIAAVIPYFYPKLVYGVKTLLRKEEKAE
jgi:hypothetical protein